MEKEVIRVWFCNRRQKEKRINPCSAAPMLPSPGKPASYSPHLVLGALCVCVWGGKPDRHLCEANLPDCPEPRTGAKSVFLFFFF